MRCRSLKLMRHTINQKSVAVQDGGSTTVVKVGDALQIPDPDTSKGAASQAPALGGTTRQSSRLQGSNVNYQEKAMAKQASKKGITYPPIPSP